MAQTARHECFEAHLALVVLAGNYELTRSIADKQFLPTLQSEAFHMVIKARRADRVVW